MRLASILRAGLVAGLAAALVTVAACGADEASGASGSGGDGASGDGGAGGDVSSATQGGAGGGMAGTGAGGAGGGVTELTVDSLESDVPIIHGLPTTVTFLAHVTDPDGPSDVAGGYLMQSKYLGDFVAVDAIGNWQVDVTFGEGDIHDGINILIARFEDKAGNFAERSVGIQVESSGCLAEPDEQSCRDCFCAVDPVGCQHYTEREYQFLYCGSSCSDACSDFCATYQAGNPDPTLMDDVCKDCQPSFDDVAAFENSCLDDLPLCIDFLVEVDNCG